VEPDEEIFEKPKYPAAIIDERFCTLKNFARSHVFEKF
jgi:hypothetical protein